MARTYPYDAPPSPPVNVSDEEKEDVNFTTVESSSASVPLRSLAPVPVVPPPPIFVESSKASQILLYDGYYYSHRGFTSEESMVFQCSRRRDIGCGANITLENVNKSNWRYDQFIIGHSHNHGKQDEGPKGSEETNRKVKVRVNKPTKKVEGAGPLLPKPIIVKNSKGTNILKHNGHCYYMSKSFTEKTHCRCIRQVADKCQGSIILQNLDRNNWSFDSFQIGNPHGPHNHEVQDLKEKDTKKRKVKVMDRETLQNKKKVEETIASNCLFCSGLVPSADFLDDQRPSSSSSRNNQYILKHEMNWRAVVFICKKLNLDFSEFSKMKEGGARGMPLCADCEKDYQGIVQFDSQRKIFEDQMSKRVQVIRDRIRGSAGREDYNGNGGEYLAFKRMVIQTTPPTIPDSEKHGRAVPSTSQSLSLGFNVAATKFEIGHDDYFDVSSDSTQENDCDLDFSRQIASKDQGQRKGRKLNPLVGRQMEDSSSSFPSDSSAVGALNKCRVPNGREEHLAKIRRQRERRRKLTRQRDPDFAVAAPSRMKLMKQRSIRTVKRRRPGQQWNVNAAKSSEEVAVAGTSMKRAQLYQTSKRIKKRRLSFTCHICDAIILGGHQNLILHYQQSHPNEERLACKYCGQRFARVSHVIIHQRLHTGDKPFSCRDCGKCFISQKNLNSHANTHKDFVHVCKACGMTFRAVQNFLGHNHMQHDDNAECTERISDLSEENLKSLGVAAPVKYKFHCHLCGDPIATQQFLRRHFTECHQDHCGDFLTCRCGIKFDHYYKVCNHARLVHPDQQQ